MGRALCQRCTRPESVCVCKALPDDGKIALQTKVPAVCPPLNAAAAWRRACLSLTMCGRARRRRRHAARAFCSLLWQGLGPTRAREAMDGGQGCALFGAWTGSFEARTAPDDRLSAFYIFAWLLARCCCGETELRVELACC